ncbi:hypothetical protein [Shimia sp.]|uniref:hypothetical protein n=1 Tax=Shimia sp. TaxID=1954381 RepID=UPI00356215A6
MKATLFSLALGAVIVTGAPLSGEPAPGVLGRPPVAGATDPGHSDLSPAFVSFEEFRRRSSAQELISGLGDFRRSALRETLDGWPGPLRYAVLTAAAVLALLALWGLAGVGRSVHGIFRHRRACRIEAVLMADLQEMDGVITVLGRHGCRFVPRTRSGRALLSRLLKTPGLAEFELFIDGRRFAVLAEGHGGAFSAFYFLQPMSRELHAGLLRLSLSAPYLVARVGAASSRGVWRRQVKARATRLKEMRATRAIGRQKGAGRAV